MNGDISFYFVSSIKDVSIGSYRIWIHDLKKYLNSMGIHVSINDSFDNVREGEVIIFGKSDIKKAKTCKKKYPKNIIGIINPKGGKVYDVDFIITGSIEEKDSLSVNKNVFIFPLIEDRYRNIRIKRHSKKKCLVLGFHGSYTHLSKFNPHLKKALEEFSNEHEIILKIITDNSSFKWVKGRPDIKSIESIAWDSDTFTRELLECDIGLIPNMVDIKPFLKKTSIDDGLYDTDYFIRMKNKSNSGRMFVFMQHGIPVIADITPSNLHILGNPDNGFAVFSKNGWLNSFRKLSNEKERVDMSLNALSAFNELYDPIEWARKLAKQIEGIK
jgi:hypothetical protein